MDCFRHTVVVRFAQDHGASKQRLGSVQSECVGPRSEERYTSLVGKSTGPTDYGRDPRT